MDFFQNIKILSISPPGDFKLGVPSLRLTTPLIQYNNIARICISRKSQKSCTTMLNKQDKRNCNDIIFRDFPLVAKYEGIPGSND